MPTRPGRRDGLFYVLFFLSGISALLYQVIWTKKLAQIFGVTAYAVSTTLSVFMLGLALGSWVFGSRVDASRRPLKTYALLEFGIALSALISLGLLEAIDALAGRIGFSSASGTGFTLFRMLGAFVVLIFPTFFMGGTLPVLAKQCVTDSGAAARKLGQLYAVNTIGGVVGCILSGFIAIPALGLRGTLLAGVGINAIVALLAYGRLVSTDEEPAAEVPAETISEPLSTPPPTTAQTRAMLAAFFMAGFLGLAAEVVWTRMMLLHLIATAQAFAAMLAVYLAGLGIGSVVAGRFLKARFSAAGYGILQILTGVSIAVCLFVFTAAAAPLFMRMQNIVHGLPSTVMNFVYQTSCGLLLTVLLLGVPTALMGAAFPFAARFFTAETGTLGRKLGGAFMLNTLGAMLGPLVCGFWLLPALGMQRSLLLFSIGYVVSGALAAAAFSVRPRFWLGCGLALAAGLVALQAGLSERIVNSAYGARITDSENNVYGKILYHEEDLCGSVVVLEVPTPLETCRQLMVGTTSMISDNFHCRRYTRLIGHLPALLHSNPKRALVICMGSGMTLSAVASHPEITAIDCADISPGIVHCAREFFQHANNGVIDDPRVHLIINDGRTHLLATPERYDIIALEPPPPNVVDVANLYSAEFYQLCRSRLNPGGMVAQWIPYHGGTFEQMRSLIGTMQSVFPRTTLWNLFDGVEYCAIGHTDEAPIPVERIRQRMAEPAVSANLAPVGIRSAEDVLCCFIMGPKRVQKFTEFAAVISDDRPGLGYDLSAYATTPESIQIGSAVTAKFAEDPFSFFDFESAPALDAFKQRFRPLKQAWLMHNRAVQLGQSRVIATPMLIDLDADFHSPLELDPGNPYYVYTNNVGYYYAAFRALAQIYKLAGESALAIRYEEEAVKLNALRLPEMRSTN